MAGVGTIVNQELLTNRRVDANCAARTVLPARLRVGSRCAARLSLPHGKAQAG